jgi:hypothetical protein
MSVRSRSSAAALVAVAALAACGRSDESGKPAPVPPAAATAATPPAPAVAAAPPATEPPVFEERAAAAGISFRMEFIPSEQGENFKINLYDHGSGVAVGDYDGDGRDDIYFVNQLGKNALYHNDGGGKFTDVTAATGADMALGDRICVAATWADYDNDGREDLYVTSTRAGNVLFHNDGGGKFSDVTDRAGLKLIAHSETGTFFDADGDGDLDLLVTGTASWTNDTFDTERHYYPGPATLFDLARRPPEPNVFYRNNGDGTFTDATAESNLAGHGWNCECAVFDYNGDGLPDVFVSSMFGSSTLYLNEGHGKFLDTTSVVLRRVSYGAVGCKAFDFDCDGRLDLFVADMHSDMWSEADLDLALVKEHRKYEMPYGPNLERGTVSPKQAENIAREVAGKAVLFGNTLYRNLGNGQFIEVSDSAGTETFQPWGVVPADFRNAGAEDVFIPSGMGYPFFFWRNNYLLNDGHGKFTECSGAAKLDPPPDGAFRAELVGGKKAARSSRSAATSDFDGDGRVDLVVNNFNERAYLYMNRSPERNWVEFRLTGTKSNRDAVGALVTLKAGGRTLVRQVQASGGYLSQSSKTLHFGLGELASVESCEILWPSGARQAVDVKATRCRIDVTESSPK